MELTVHHKLDPRTAIVAEITFSLSRYFPAQTYGPPEYCYPAEGGELEIESVRVVEVTLTGDDEQVLSIARTEDGSLSSAEAEALAQRFQQAIESDAALWAKIDEAAAAAAGDTVFEFDPFED